MWWLEPIGGVVFGRAALLNPESFLVMGRGCVPARAIGIAAEDEPAVWEKMTG
jgi:hypothetical protein